ncbi:Unknown protein sequence [Pseudomonas syringae pv. cilantro]|uniref:Uncharacterized protein n=1 Tax=Pseudomonas syringae pv. cilantro TaxID=81035 RepID=A0A0N0GFF2_PSESX|nr:MULTISPECIES: hypothetical protein [Pseudomonas syringae group]KPC31412.1 Unknown protein sequence [Pseudomonas syringae pv. cilantro]
MHDNLLRDFLSLVNSQCTTAGASGFGQSARLFNQAPGILQAKFMGFNTFCNETIDELQVTL